MSIPKIIWTAWFSEDRKIPEHIQKYIDSQKIDRYEHHLITLDNLKFFDNYIDECLHSFHGNKKWVKLTDYIRMNYLYTYGGIFLDADVKILPNKNFNHLLNEKMFVGKELEQPDGRIVVGSAIVGAEKGHHLIREWMNIVRSNYRGDDDECYNSSMHQLNLLAVSGKYEMIFLKPHVLFPYNHIKNKLDIREDTITIHHYIKTWSDNPLLANYISNVENNINFLHVKRGDGEMACMNGDIGGNCDRHPYSKELGEGLKEAFEYLKDRATIVEWDNQREYNCLLHRIDNEVDAVSKFYKLIINSNRPKIFIGPEKLKDWATIIGATHIIIPELNVFQYYNEIIKEIPIIDNGIYMFSAGMPAKLMIGELVRKNINATYLDCGSSFDMIAYQSRTYQITKEKFLELYLPTISIIIPQLGREEGLRKCLESIKQLNYPQSKITTHIIDGDESVPIKMEKGRQNSIGEYLVYAANDMTFEKDCLYNAIIESIKLKKRLISFNEGPVLPDEGNICTHFLIKRDLVDRLGGIFDLEFTHVGCDNLLWKRTSDLNESYHSSTAKIVHNHWSKGNVFDEIYQKGWNHIEKDRLLLKQKLSI